MEVQNESFGFDIGEYKRLKRKIFEFSKYEKEWGNGDFIVWRSARNQMEEATEKGPIYIDV